MEQAFPWGIVVFGSIPILITIGILLTLVFGSDETKEEMGKAIKNYHPPGHE